MVCKDVVARCGGGCDTVFGHGFANNGSNHGLEEKGLLLLYVGGRLISFQILSERDYDIRSVEG